MKNERAAGLAWWAAATIFVSAFLLFQVQPVISKKILPWFGGSPAVWTTCMLFFQVLLLGGYGYAHWLTRTFRPRVQGIVHAVLLGIALCTLPITPSDFWKPGDGNYPELRILLLLAAKVGIPYFLLSSTGPLVQAWFNLAYPGRSPYRLYALSNVGSLAALLSYPFWFETTFTVNTQGNLWSLGFIVFGLLCGGLAVVIYRLAASFELAVPEQPATPPKPVKPTKAAEAPQEPIDENPSWALRIGWLLLAALASMSLLAVTNHLCQDIAVVPFMWVAPLSLYLLSFIICFDREIWYSRKLFGTAGVLTIAAMCAIDRYSDLDSFLAKLPGYVGMKIEGTAPFSGSVDWILTKMQTGLTIDDLEDSVFAQATLYLTVLFLICMLCHGELVKSKPRPRYLTMFYLMISAGGAVGGLFVAIICPLVFKTHFELPLSIICGFVVAWIALANDGRKTWLAGREWLQWSAAFLVVGGVILVARAKIEGPDEDVLAQTRNFYGTLKVKSFNAPENPSEPPGESTGRALYHGRILHGFQYLSPERIDEATTYYDEGTGAGIAVKYYPRAEGAGLRVAVIGLGTGTMAAHAKKGDTYRFYDINPDVIRISDAWFSFRSRAVERGAKMDTILGDARIQMERELKENKPQAYDVIVLDAFTGDAIPAHLLTAEAIEIYEQHLRKDAAGNVRGILAVHISNRYLDLEPVVVALSKKYNFEMLGVHFEEGPDTGDTGSDWILMTRNKEFLAITDVVSAGEPVVLPEGTKEVLWTDQSSNLFEILK